MPSFLQLRERPKCSRQQLHSHLGSGQPATLEGSPMEQRLSLITLGISDRDRARKFYEALGWKTGAEEADDVVFFQAGSMVVALWGRAKLAEDSAVTEGSGWGGVTLAY